MTSLVAISKIISNFNLCTVRVISHILRLTRLTTHAHKKIFRFGLLHMKFASRNE